MAGIAVPEIPDPADRTAGGKIGKTDGKRRVARPRGSAEIRRHASLAYNAGAVAVICTSSKIGEDIRTVLPRDKGNKTVVYPEM